MCKLIAKYNKPAPRYTSYPTVPYWDQEAFRASEYTNRLVQAFALHKEQGIALYLHLPFCESMCTFCGCHKRITKRHEVEFPYIEALVKEMQLYNQLLGVKPKVREIHLGGGTPTFFSPGNLSHLMLQLLKHIELTDDCELSFEGHPGNTSREHLQSLYDRGFRRVCFGVQDYNPTVQKAINRIQTVAQVAEVTRIAREIGYTSVGHDLIYGLPFQTEEHIKYTLAQTEQIQPDRISWYSYAHVPWIKGNGQRGFDESNLPSAQEKDQQKHKGKQRLLELGYKEVGMDHFALPEDPLTLASEQGQLHRNFMGYTSRKTSILIGLGASSISDCGTSFAQNRKGIDEYQALLKEGVLPLYRGHLLTLEDNIIRKSIEELMCTFRLEKPNKLQVLSDFPLIREEWIELEADGLIEFKNQDLLVTERGKPYLRNIAASMDLRLLRKRPEKRTFSMSI